MASHHYYEYERYAALGGQSPSQFGGESSNLLYKLCLNPGEAAQLKHSNSSHLEETPFPLDDTIAHSHLDISCGNEWRIAQSDPIAESTQREEAPQSVPPRSKTRTRTRAVRKHRSTQEPVAGPSTSYAASVTSRKGKKKETASKGSADKSDELPQKKTRLQNKQPKSKEPSAKGGHSGVVQKERYQCHLCPATLSSHGALTRHLLSRKHTQKPGYVCPLCEVATTRDDSIKRHWKEKHPGLPFPDSFVQAV
ncbi:hypothetical protein HYPSUDRAFT_216956 [Hypholoma sublateritium FD-334 SS-4]|uniref:C2H2-type domain-containing protein n=1 Tax=Hypholoma sublateritium (strain FD-334 SS-4) TaxID=945553 RepID=A0A0D2NP64_HYPSF|nr:hypothetical protein HYPSUDRAFT_216956 [Hypholoma sublateritium FD-334 SS-4]